jgi:hypothetical protein
MTRIKRFKQFNEDATGNASTAGMGAVTASQPGASPGTTGTDGSGDIPVYFRKSKRRKMGDPSEVSDAQDLAPVKTNKVKE